MQKGLHRSLRVLVISLTLFGGFSSSCFSMRRESGVAVLRNMEQDVINIRQKFEQNKQNLSRAKAETMADAYYNLMKSAAESGVRFDSEWSDFYSVLANGYDKLERGFKGFYDQLEAKDFLTAAALSIVVSFRAAQRCGIVVDSPVAVVDAEIKRLTAPKKAEVRKQPVASRKRVVRKRRSSIFKWLIPVVLSAAAVGGGIYWYKGYSAKKEKARKKKKAKKKAAAAAGAGGGG